MTSTKGLMELMQAPPRGYGSDKPRGLEPEYADVYKTWRAAPTPENATALINNVQPILDTALKPLGNSPALRGHAKRITLTAMRNYDPERAGLRTHLMSHLQGLKRLSGQLDTPIAIPERVQLQQRTAAESSRELADELGREPSDIELADRTGLSVKRLGALRQYRRPVSESMANFDSPDGEIIGPAVEKDTPQSILEDFVYSDMSPRDQLVMDYAVGRNGRPKLNGREIAAKLNITPGAVSQRMAAIQQRFDTMRDSNLFGG